MERLRASAANSGTLIIPDELQHLKRGGRLTPLAAALGGLLKIASICDWIYGEGRWMCTIGSYHEQGTVQGNLHISGARLE